MQSSTPDGPTQAWKVPVVVFAMVLLLALTVWLGARFIGWWALLLVPVVLFSLAIAVNVVVALVKGPMKG